jgi:hypothetical protein
VKKGFQVSKGCLLHRQLCGSGGTPLKANPAPWLQQRAANGLPELAGKHRSEAAWHDIK